MKVGLLAAAAVGTTIVLIALAIKLNPKALGLYDSESRRRC